MASHDHGIAEFRFCPRCGERMKPAEVDGRSRPRCAACGFVHFANPGVGAAVVLRDGAGRILLVRRGPGATRSGLWCVPAGYVDAGEDVRDAAARELREETGLVAEVGEVLQVASNRHDPAKPTVGIWFAGTITGGDLAPGDDADEAGWFPIDDPPPLAFPTDAELLARLRAGDRGRP
jgi:ADP-ribose pyrophosphatase YjhB (NUDIX family)